MPDPGKAILGGCLCGAVRYAATGPPVGGFYCHCRMCQRNYGLVQATVRFSEGFSFTRGAPRHFKATAFASRAFCGDCGSALLFTYEGRPDVWVLVGSLDHPEDWPLTKDAAWGQSGYYHFDLRIPWFDIAEGLPRRGSESTPLRDAAMARSGQSTE